MSLDISRNSQENTCTRVAFLLKLQAWPATFLKKRLLHRCFLVNFVKFLRTSFLRSTSGRLLLFLPHQRNIIVCKYKLHGKPIMKYQSWTCFWYWCWKNLFFISKLKLLIINFNFPQFHEHVFRSSRSQMLFKIGVLKNYTIQNYELKKDSNTGVFAVRSSHMMLTYW